jgi:hypothetical protein
MLPIIVGYVFGPLPPNIFFHVIVAYSFATKSSFGKQVNNKIES